MYTNMYFGDISYDAVRQINMATGIIQLVAGTPGTPGVIVNGVVSAARKTPLNDPYGLAFDSLGNLYIANQRSHNVSDISFEFRVIIVV